MNKEKILIIGSSGGIAQEIKYQFKEIYDLKFLSKKEIDAYKNTNRYNYEINKFKPKFVINCSVISGIKNCEENPEKAYFINGYLPYFLYLSCRKVKAKFIHFSSECVFEGRVFKKKYSENSKSKPTTILGKSKRQSEILLARANSTLVIRLPMLFGPRQRKHLIYKILKNLKKNKKIFASTDIFSTPVYVPYLVKFIREKFIENEKFFKLKRKNNLINFSSNEYISIFNFIKLFAKELKKEKYIFPVKDSYFDKNSEKPKYLGLKSLKKYSTNHNLHTCVKNYLKAIY